MQTYCQGIWFSHPTEWMLDRHVTLSLFQVFGTLMLDLLQRTGTINSQCFIPAHTSGCSGINALFSELGLHVGVCLSSLCPVPKSSRDTKEASVGPDRPYRAILAQSSVVLATYEDVSGFAYSATTQTEPSQELSVRGPLPGPGVTEVDSLATVVEHLQQ